MMIEIEIEELFEERRGKMCKCVIFIRRILVKDYFLLQCHKQKNNIKN